MDTFVYVDGFNLYYGAVKGTPYKWLNVRQLCELLLPKHNIVRVKYFTARVSARPGDPINKFAHPPSRTPTAKSRNRRPGDSPT